MPTSLRVLGSLSNMILIALYVLSAFAAITNAQCTTGSAAFSSSACPETGGPCNMTSGLAGVWDDAGRCIPNCSANQVVSPSGECVTPGGPCGDAGGTYDQNGVCQPKTCPPGQVVQVESSGGECVTPGTECGDDAGKVWQPDGTCNCPSSKEPNQQGVCVDKTCPPGKELKNGVCVDITCPARQELKNGTCVDKTCPTGQKLNDQGICEDDTCPTGQAKNAQNTCVPTCKADEELNEENICVLKPCPANQERNPQGVCVDKETETTCPSNQVKNAEGNCETPIEIVIVSQKPVIFTSDNQVHTTTTPVEVKASATPVTTTSYSPVVTTSDGRVYTSSVAVAITTLVVLPAQTSGSESKSSPNIGAIAGGAAGGVVAAALIGGLAFHFLKKPPVKIPDVESLYKPTTHYSSHYDGSGGNPFHSVSVTPSSAGQMAGNAAGQTYVDNYGQGVDQLGQGQTGAEGQQGQAQIQQDPSQLAPNYVDNLDPSDLDLDHRLRPPFRPRPDDDEDQNQYQNVYPNQYQVPNQYANQYTNQYQYQQDSSSSVPSPPYSPPLSPPAGSHFSGYSGKR